MNSNAFNNCLQGGGRIPGTGKDFVIRFPCGNPTDKCPRPPSGPGAGKIGNIGGGDVYIKPRDK